MAKYADLDRVRQEHLLANKHALFLAVSTLAKATGQSFEYCAERIADISNAAVDDLNDLEIAEAIRQIDSTYDSGGQNFVFVKKQRNN